MTLCTAWIRQAGATDELVFATDSCLTGGEKWKQGIKLFELPRKDCLLCFAGSTARAYPLVLNLVSSIDLDDYLQTPEASLDEVLDYITELFTGLIQRIVSEVDGEDIHELRDGARFLFGGWDWQNGDNGDYRVWELQYSSDLEGFVHNELWAVGDKTRYYTFLGDASIDVEKEAKTRVKQLFYDDDKMDDRLDMEPLQILRDISLDKDIREVDGSLQIAKVYKSNRTEFFGIYWESSKGKPCFQGREYNEINKPKIRYINPDTLEILDNELPNCLASIDEETYGLNHDFVKDCYSEDGNYIRQDLKEKDKHLLRSIFKDVAYRNFIEVMETPVTDPITNEDEEE